MQDAHARRGKLELMLFAVGGGVLYMATVLVLTAALGEHVPLLGWIGFAVASTLVLATSTALGSFLVRSSAAAGSAAPARPAPRTPGTHRLLVVADAGCSGEDVCRPLTEQLADRPSEVLVVAPALVTATHYLDSDVDAARSEAAVRLAETVGAFRAQGIPARGLVGSESPLEAIADSLAVYGADEIVIATPPARERNWLEAGVVDRAREIYDLPVRHLLVLTRGRAGARAA
jgi:hypothetical protein